ncbi:cytochrome c [Allomuricauda sp. NBRC 101325]|uniref:c-type cytochrome n=1 Tax=Allomuricauda sp. NBRC 101325 TaxID=1113758 RepID=UPI00249FB06F|nr:cytochrome c [Muricauda sp. NBRC 101325]GLU44888.1 hypothetical protein Musp01_25120 [Muricauda sp. NBRC 101325]
MKKSFIIIPILVGGFALQSMSTSNFEEQEKWVAPEEYQNMKNPYANYEDEDRIGQMMYSKYCKMCHGKKGLGDGSAGKVLDTPVANFTTPEFKEQTDGSIYYKISKGRSNMPSFEKVIQNEEDFWMLVNYIKEL